MDEKSRSALDAKFAQLKSRFGSCYPTAEADEISAFEVKLSAELPPEFRYFLRLLGGGYCPDGIEISSEVEEIQDDAVTVFQSLNAESPSSRLGAFAADFEENKNIIQVLQFADTVGGERLVMDLRRKNYGHIFYSCPDGTWRQIADSFAQFIDQLELT
ncbi:SMI1/KNR4 family protein [Stratiformator vulcanicus]|uniref:SMI1 / KNR4 family protein n=1 Tax=Stratiformator vulcanicus TaxID=2527980 RepID=A0A517R644_9PLAN|nr:SMI1/KNR4 family protein [Stratiformator vulcanicus]QDT39341.1 SMI1 / KNR4 family protein [Stratiformator vulcanicus]